MCCQHVRAEVSWGLVIGYWSFDFGFVILDFGLERDGQRGTGCVLRVEGLI